MRWCSPRRCGGRRDEARAGMSVGHKRQLLTESNPPTLRTPHRADRRPILVSLIRDASCPAGCTNDDNRAATVTFLPAGVSTHNGWRANSSDIGIVARRLLEVLICLSRSL